MGQNPFSRRKGNPRSLQNRSPGARNLPTSHVGHPDSSISRSNGKPSSEAKESVDAATDRGHSPTPPTPHLERPAQAARRRRASRTT
jgi:hypothetical protein